MVNLDWRVDRSGGIALVTVVVENPTAVARRVRVANRLDGPVWPPRCEGVPEAGWDDGGFEGVVAPGESHPLGYATPTPPADSPEESPADSPEDSPTESPAAQPVELVWTERAAEPEVEGRSDTGRCADAFEDGSTPEAVVRSLGDPRPPADAVPTPAGDADATPGDGSPRRSP